ncbi:hypothetical protein BSKO_10320 [Bryopsis sp. KO-2023]|nr:hypothetical protein BSKO_10320 [Bryopsis sp. KO-2023]
MSGDAVCPDELSAWALNSREAHFHAELLSQSVHFRVARLIEKPALDIEQTRQLLIVLRNLCSGGASVAEAILETGVLPAVKKIATKLCCKSDSWDDECVRDENSEAGGELRALRAGTQFLANMSTASEACSSAIWKEFFPVGFLQLAKVKLWHIIGPLCTCLVSCARSSKQFSSALCSRAGTPILSELLDFGRRVEGTENERFGENEWLLMLVGRLVYCEGLLDEMFANLHSESDPQCKMGISQLHLLQFLAIPDVLDWVPEDENSGEGMYKAFASVFQIAKNLTLMLMEPGASSANATEALEPAFMVLKNLSCLDQNTLRENGRDVVSEVCESGLVKWLLDCLRALGSIKNPRTPPEAGVVDDAKGGGDFTARMEGLDLAEGVPVATPYVGFRTDIVAILSNVVFRRPGIQNMVLKLEGVPLLLNQCQVDDVSPLVREWAVWAIRNLCEDNLEIQNMVRGLEVQGVVKSEELDRLGIKIEVDRSTGKLRVGKKEYGAYTYI